MADDNEVADVEFGELKTNGNNENTIEDAEKRKNLEMIYEIPLRVTVKLGETQMPIRELLNLGAGAVVELDRLAGESIDLLVNGILVGKGDVVVVNENFGLRITEIVSQEERIKTLS